MSSVPAHLYNRSSDPSAPSTAALVDAPIWRRIAARIIDVPFFIGLAFVYIVPIAIILMPLYPFISLNTWSAIGTACCLALALYGTEWLLLARRDGQTLGKGLLGLRVVWYNKEAEARAYRSSALRLLILYVTVFSPLAFITVPAALIATRKQRQLLPPHDLVARTRVVLAPKRGLSPKKDLLLAAPVPRRIDVNEAYELG
jgi:uncharacterized RDD family membrane protein YckC